MSDAESFELLARGRALIEMRRYDEAVALLGQAAAENPGDVEIRSELANALGWARRRTEALRVAEEAIALDPDYAWAHHLRGIELWELDRLDEAIEATREAVRLDPFAPASVMNLAHYCASMWRLEEARAAGAVAARLDPEDAFVWFVRGFTAMGLGRYRTAERYFRRSLELDPAGSYGANNLGYCLLLQRRVDEAIELFRHALELDAADPAAPHNLAHALRRGGRWDEAAEVERLANEAALARAEHVLAQDAANHLAHLNRADSLSALGRSKEAVEAVKAALRVVPDGGAAARCWARLAELEWEPGDPARCQESLAAGAQRDPDNYQVLYAQANIASLNQDLQVARRAVDRLRRLYPVPADTRLAEGFVALAEAKWERARDAFDQAIKRRAMERRCGDFLGKAIAELHLGSERQARLLQEEAKLINPCRCHRRLQLESRLNARPANSDFAR